MEPDVTRVARQEIETERLMGVDFVPVRRRREQPRDESAGPAPPPATAPSSGVTLPFPEPAEPPPIAGREAREQALAELRSRHDAECPHCTQAEGYLQTVFGEGRADALVMFVGEAPGAEEDRTGRPFVGRAGQKLDDMIAAMGMARGDVYIANILKSRPPDNRTPLPHEVAACAPYLAEQIRIIRPKVIVALGGPAAKFLLDTSLGITRLRGTWATYEDGGVSIDVMPTFHPAYLLRNYTRETREKVWSDLQAVVRHLNVRN